MIETEAGRGESYANPVEYPEIGGYDVLPLRENFSPETYGSAIAEVEKAGYDALIVDSASHEWSGVGGVLDMADKREAEGKKGMLIWQKPKIDHQKYFMLRFMQTPIPLVILNMRARYPMVEVYNDRKGKKEPVRSTELEPNQSEDILFEMFVHGWIDKEHNFHQTKITAKGLHPVFESGKKITLDTGRALAKWASGDIEKPAEESPEQKIKRTAGIIVRAIQACKELGDIENLLYEFSAEIETVKAASQAAYDHVMAEKSKKIAALEER